MSWGKILQDMHLQLFFNTINAVLFSVNLASCDNCEDWQNSCPLASVPKYQPGGIAAKAQVLIPSKPMERDMEQQTAPSEELLDKEIRRSPGLHDFTTFPLGILREWNPK